MDLSAASEQAGPNGPALRIESLPRKGSGITDTADAYRMIPIPASTESMTAAAMTEPTWPPALAPMACMSR